MPGARPERRRVLAVAQAHGERGARHRVRAVAAVVLDAPAHRQVRARAEQHAVLHVDAEVRARRAAAAPRRGCRARPSRARPRRRRSARCRVPTETSAWYPAASRAGLVLEARPGSGSRRAGRRPTTPSHSGHPASRSRPGSARAGPCARSRRSAAARGGPRRGAREAETTRSWRSKDASRSGRPKAVGPGVPVRAVVEADDRARVRARVEPRAGGERRRRLLEAAVRLLVVGGEPLDARVPVEARRAPPTWRRSRAASRRSRPRPRRAATGVSPGRARRVCEAHDAGERVVPVEAARRAAHDLDPLELEGQRGAEVEGAARLVHRARRPRARARSATRRRG